MGHEILTELVLVMAASVAAAALLRRIQVPPVVGFIIAGILIGPGGFGLVHDREQIEVVAEVGVMLLLFTVGLKLKLGDLWKLRTSVFGGGALQVVVTGGIAFGVAVACGRPIPEAVVWGAMIALSSTALVLWLLEGSGDTGTGHGRTMVSILLFQDLAVVPIMLALPLLAGQAATMAEVGWLLARSAAVIILTVVGARFVFPWVTARIVAAGSRELFTLTTFLVAVGTALVFGHFGLSMALGAFLAGMVVSESQYVGRMIDDITPLRDLFNSLFFVSMGMLVEPRMWVEQPLLGLGLVAGIMLIKALVAGGVAWPILRSPAAWAVGLGLAQVGEFSIVVAAEALRMEVLGPEQHKIFLAAAVPTLIFTPFIMRLGCALGRKQTATESVPEISSLTDHVIIVGYGINGRNVAHALKLLAIPHVVLDLNPYTIEEIRRGGGYALEGDARQLDVLKSVRMERARGLVATVPDAVSTREVVAAARKLNVDARIIARTPYLREVQGLRDIGADVVIPEEVETSLELAGRVLKLYGAPQRVVEREKAALRREGYGLLLGEISDEDHPTLTALCQLPEVSRVAIPEGSEAVGQSLRQLNLRHRTGATVLAIERDGEVAVNPTPEKSLRADDGLIVFADASALDALQTLLKEPSPEQRL